MNDTFCLSYPANSLEGRSLLTRCIMSVNNELGAFLSQRPNSCLLHGVLVAFGSAITFGFAVFAYSAFFDPGEDEVEKSRSENEYPARDPKSRESSDPSSLEWYPNERAPAGEDAGDTATLPRAEPDAISKFVGHNEPFCGITADWADRRPQGYFVTNMDATVLRKRSTALPKRRSAPVTNFRRHATQSAPSSSKAVASVKADHSVDGGCSGGEVPLQSSFSRATDTLSIDGDASQRKSDATLTSVENCTSTEQISEPQIKDAAILLKKLSKNPESLQIFIPDLAREKVLTLLGILSIPSIVEILKKYSVEEAVTNVGISLNALCSAHLKSRQGTSFDTTTATQVLNLEEPSLTWDAILGNLSHKLKEKSGLKSKVVQQLFGLRVATVIECKSCDAFITEEEKLFCAFPVSKSFLGNLTRRYTLLSCLKKQSEPSKVRGEHWTRCIHKGNLFKRKLVTSFPDLLLFEKVKEEEEDFVFPPFPLALDLSGITSRKEFRPRYKLHAVTVSCGKETMVYFRFDGAWFEVDGEGTVERMRIASEEKFHLEKLMNAGSIVTLAYFKELLWRPEGQQL
ncbi:unnamed protein product [Notodromas monacha]|uniref:PAN2 UCH domain-containing protein n=1 Tax=Notodromas monacha TaxID=399045 RepID=A0A7R9BUG5_9CRUS|nr:unnamed protein product [Notodromas monacha]CAG0921981.1 unnamed protein product [Notodromas monacha]